MKNLGVGCMDLLPDAELYLVGAGSRDIGKAFEDEGAGVGVDGFKVVVGVLSWVRGGWEVCKGKEAFDKFVSAVSWCMGIWEGGGVGWVIAKGQFLGGPDVVGFGIGEEEGP
jgi:hypothetical protein